MLRASDLARILPLVPGPQVTFNYVGLQTYHGQRQSTGIFVSATDYMVLTLGNCQLNAIAVSGRQNCRAFDDGRYCRG
jgi:hypothetical protein